jgi:predicted nucleotidyltransferase
MTLVDDSTLSREVALQLLSAHKAVLAAQFGVKELALFGSTARDCAHKDSDVDILVTFEGPASAGRYFGVLFYLEDLLRRPVDLVTEKGLRQELRNYVEREAIHV